ncbi:MAG: mechanosensitive ion channel [Flavobacteriales bacterium]|nr:mechanosensitive ion channel [Flavobacteriales bacterium]
MENLEKYIDMIKEGAVEYAPKLLLVIVTLWGGLRVINWLVKLLEKNMAKSKVELTLSNFLGNMISWVLKVLLFISAASMIGIETTSFIAILGAAGLAIGLSLQGALANFAGGVLLIIFKPYKVGDVIDAQGALGQVKEVQIFTTVLLNPNNETIIIPNGPVIGGNIKNYSKEGKIRHNLAMGISYDANIKEARKVLIEAMENHPLVLKDPAPSVIVSELGDSSVNLMLRPWCVPADYWTVMGDIMESGKEALDAAKISIPFPQMDVHMNKVD